MARLLVSGSRALFRRPEFSNAAISYDVITPWAARRIFEAVHWTPSIWWRVESIEILSPIRFEEYTGSSCGPGSMCLANVSYVLKGHFDMTRAAGPGENPAQHSSIFKKRARRGDLFRTPFLGQVDMPAKVKLLDYDDHPPTGLSQTGTIDLGWMVYDRELDDRASVHFFRPRMINGMIDLSSVDLASLPS